ncbi:jg2812 [Pararge aegeria aegeria]|uniref:Jg2812 protein n=1 Tax=Pararge aegeria aegeria TaxID=348720 RepID=A0A8S4S5X5_9NEOP|nr:jg2812 [Pararge aegeria aegeria]
MARDNNFDKDMLLKLVKNRGKAERAIHAAQGDENLIPAGINLGGYCMMKLPKSLLLVFPFLDGWMDTFIKKREIQDGGAVPSFEEQIIRRADYFRDRFGRSTDDDVFMDRLKVDLDKWLKDYFNDYLMYYVAAEDAEFEKYNQKKTMALNQYADKAINKVIERLGEINANAVYLPTFEIHSMSVAEVSLKDGVLRGLDSIYRRSVTTGTKNNNVRTVDTVVSFSSLKCANYDFIVHSRSGLATGLSYRYEAVLKSGLPPVTGVLTLTADELTAHMALSLTKHPEAVDLSFTFLEQAKPETLTMEGPASRMISNFKYMLEHHIIAIMSNTLMHNIQMLGTLDRCIPLLAPYMEAEVNASHSNEDKKSLPAPNKRTETETTNIDDIIVTTGKNLTEDFDENDKQNILYQEPQEEYKKHYNNWDNSALRSNEELSKEQNGNDKNLNDYNNTDIKPYIPNIILPGLLGNWTEEDKKKFIERKPSYKRSVSRKLEKKQSKRLTT